MTVVKGWICGPRVYRFKGWLFEWHYACGPWPIKIDGTPFKRAGDKFFKVCAEFSQLTKEEKEQHRVGGGCVPI